MTAELLPLPELPPGLAGWLTSNQKALLHEYATAYALANLSARPGVGVGVDEDWISWPTALGYWWFKESPDASPELVYVQAAKDGHALCLWDCPGIGRSYLDYEGAGIFLRLAMPKAALAKEPK